MQSSTLPSQSVSSLIHHFSKQLFSTAGTPAALPSELCGGKKGVLEGQQEEVYALHSHWKESKALVKIPR